LTLQTALLLERLEWEDWDLLPGAQLPKADSVEKLLPGYAALYDPSLVENRDRYLETLKDRFHQRRVYLQNSDLHNRPDLLMRLVNALMVRA
jgi:phosphoenolpyruvate carboxykinase (ATP)